MINTILILLSFLAPNPPKNVYDFSFKTIDGKEVKLSQFKGKKILIVNTASMCGYTPQYEDLEKLHKQYGKKLVVIGFPEGNFGGQEFSTDAEIKKFCTGKYNVTFMLAQKSSVMGSDISPLFKYLTTQTNTEEQGDIKWNFEKFLINEKGELVHRFRSKTKPMDEAILKNL
ncbi:glutathione peroxidase [Pedobacter changchengzhani]|uniref:Glutathione peroxidase n=1 Tax=Pedobacter changchengzhani TaxID=2529274 RepID=A0A4R5MJH6_9SPHI|nr:glutathione peroxidase [Pedobacter changchengzhani]TDG35682.1 glutathione peroxidase [Pedobacter changchengzhani]